MVHEISTDQLLRYIDGTLNRGEKDSVCMALRSCTPLGDKLEGLVYLYEQNKGDVLAVKNLLQVQQQRVKGNLFSFTGGIYGSRTSLYSRLDKAPDQASLQNHAKADKSGQKRTGG